MCDHLRADIGGGNRDDDGSYSTGELHSFNILSGLA